MLKIEDQIAQLADAVDAQLQVSVSPGPIDGTAADGSLRSPIASARVRAGQSSAPSGVSRWALGAAAAVVLGAGLAALVVASSRDIEPSPPANSTTGDDVDGGLPSVNTVPFQFAEPLDPDLVPLLDPSPGEPESISRGTAFEWVSGFESLTLFGVLDESGALGGVVVLESAMPWEAISDGLEVTKINGTDSVTARTGTETGVFIRNGDVTRAVFDMIAAGDDPGPGSGVSADALEIAELVGDRPFDDLPESERIVRMTLQDGPSATVRYGSPQSMMLIRQTVPTSADTNDFALVAQLLQRFHSISDLPSATPFVAFEQVSPTDLIVAAAATQSEADDAIANVDFAVRAADKDLNPPFGYDQIVARGEPSWGRWEVATRTTDPNCWRFTAQLWGPSNYGDSATSCHDAGSTDALPSSFCLRMNDRVIGALLDASSVPNFEGALASTTFESTIERTDATLSFEIRDPNDPTTAPQVDISVDEIELRCAI